MSSHGDSVLLTAKLILWLEGISSAVFTQQHAVNMCVNEARAKKNQNFPETVAFLRQRCFMLECQC